MENNFKNIYVSLIKRFKNLEKIVEDFKKINGHYSEQTIYKSLKYLESYYDFSDDIAKTIQFYTSSRMVFDLDGKRNYDEYNDTLDLKYLAFFTMVKNFSPEYDDEYECVQKLNSVLRKDVLIIFKKEMIVKNIKELEEKIYSKYKKNKENEELLNKNLKPIRKFQYSRS